MLFTEAKFEALVTADDLPQRLALALSGGHRGAPQGGQMSPELSYGRHAGPAPWTARRAAVMLLLFRRGGRWHLPLTERPATLRNHAGQISLPGGAINFGESARDAALRELFEELGFAAPHLVIGSLPDCYVFASDFLVSPWVAASFEPNAFWRPHDREVQDVIELPLDLLLDDRCRGRMTVERGPLTFHAPCIQIGPTCIWGATSVILAELAELVLGLVTADERR